MKSRAQGFTLFEVLISMFIIGVAVLGLVKLELTILRSSQSSFNYSVAIVEANTLVDNVWMQLCEIEDGDTTYSAVYTDWQNQLTGTFSGTTSSATGTLVLNDEVIVSWQDGRFSSDSDSIATLVVNYPDFSGKCL